MVSRGYGSYFSSEERIKKLEEELWFARTAILEMVPVDVDFNGYYRCENRGETYKWRSDLMKEIISKAEMRTPPEGNYWGEHRANCPLCGAGGSSFMGAEGYKIPSGLEMHLEGRGNAHQCVVMKAAMALARDYWNKKFSASELAEETAKAEEKTRREKTEITYLTDPTGKPKLNDDFFGASWKSTRDQTQMEWAEKRMAELGVRTVREGKTISYVDERDDIVIYADPRVNGVIDFNVFKKSLVKKGKGQSTKYVRLGHFDFQDKWKNDLKEKYESRVAKSAAR